MNARRTVLLTLGRLPKTLDFARAFKLAGWRVLVAEPFKSHLTGSSRAVDQCFMTPPPNPKTSEYLTALRDIIIREKVDLVLPVSEETMYVAHLAGSLPTSVRVYAPPPKPLLELHDKLVFNRLLVSLGIPAPTTEALDTPAAAALLAEMDVITKPILSCSGRGVSFHRRGDPLPKPEQGWLVQQRIDGAHVSTFSMAHEGRVQVTVVYRGTIMDNTVAVAFERIDMPVIDAWVQRFVAARHHSGFISFDFIIGADGVPMAIECNPRVTSGVHFIEPEDLAAAITAPFARPIRFRVGRKMQQFWPTLTKTQGSIHTPAIWRRNVGLLFSSRDVTWDWRDPKPLLAMPVTAFGIIWQSMRLGKTFGEIATEDISWTAEAARLLGSTVPVEAQCQATTCQAPTCQAAKAPVVIAA
jgi:ATP-grasp domain